MTIALFIFFNLTLHFFFRGVLIFSKKLFNSNIDVDSYKLFELPIFILYPVFSLFVLGNIALILNFITPVSNIRLGIYIIVFLFVAFNFFQKINYDYKFSFVSFLFIPSVLAISSYGINIHYDAIDYHLNHQSIILYEKIIIGMQNIRIQFGWSTIYEYIQSLLFFENNLLYLHFVNLIYLSLIFSFIAYCLFFNKSIFYKIASLNLILFSFLDNFGVSGGGNAFLQIQMLGKVDIAFGVIFSLTYLFFLYDIFNKTYSKKSFLLLNFFVLYSIQLKVFGLYLLMPYSFYLYRLIKEKIKISELVKSNSIAILLGILYLFKNFIVSGCFIFPLSATCVPNISWANIDRVKVFSDGVRYSYENNIAFKFSYNIKDWFEIWINHAYNYQIHVNFLGSLLIIYLVSSFLTKNNNHNSFARNLNLFFIFLLVFTYILTGPTFRYGFGIYLIIVFSINLGKNQLNYKILNSKYFLSTLSLIFFLSVGLTPRIYSYQLFFEEPFKIFSISKFDNPYYLEKLNMEYGNYDSLECYIEPTCIKFEKFSETSLMGYRLFKK